MKCKEWSVLVPALLMSWSLLQAAELKVAAIFQDHAILQRDMAVPVWGWSDAGTEVSVTFAGQKKKAKADASGKWMVKLDPLHTSTGSGDMEISSINPQSQSQSIKLRDILVGEVWLGSGQSNMAMPVMKAKDFAQEQKKADLPLVRMFREDSLVASAPQMDAKGKWVISTPESVGKFSATLYFFSREIHKSLGHVPIGLINSSVGGTAIEAWIDADVQKASTELTPLLNTLPEIALTPEKLQANATSRKVRARHRGGVGGLFNGKISPLIPYGIRGAIWYQGEANSTPDKAQFYQYQLPLLIKDWRKRWGYDFPFAWAQLPNFRAAGRDWPLVREAMLKTLALPNTGMAINIDIGDCDNIHPPNKQEVGRRLSLWALGTVYGQQVDSTSGPLPAGHQVRNSEIVVTFAHADKGLDAKGGELKGFVIAGRDKQWKPAHARIEGDKVVIFNSEVKQPVAVRYAWQNLPECNLYNGAGLPASPFRTDDWN